MRLKNEKKVWPSRNWEVLFNMLAKRFTLKSLITFIAKMTSERDNCRIQTSRPDGRIWDELSSFHYKILKPQDSRNLALGTTSWWIQVKIETGMHRSKNKSEIRYINERGSYIILDLIQARLRSYLNTVFDIYTWLKRKYSSVQCFLLNALRCQTVIHLF